MEREQRRLTAIVVADVSGYSRLVGRDETGTLRRLKNHRCELFDPLIESSGGRIVKTMGDGLLLEFSSVVQAVNWSLTVQRGMRDRNAGLNDNQAIQFRIGIHLGDVIIDNGDILGDGVNISSRLEAIAPVGGIAVSSMVYDYLDEATASLFEDKGHQELKNIRRPIYVWTWQDTNVASQESIVAASQSIDDLASIAVLPFRSLGADAEAEFLAEAISEDITTTLAQISGLVVISQMSASRYRKENIDHYSVAKNLNARYLLRGRVQAAAARVRVTAQLIDAKSDAQIWAERYDRSFEDVFDLQDRLTREIVTALRIKLTDGEQARVWLRSTDNIDAWRYAMRGADHLWIGTALSIVQARDWLQKAVEEDPNYAAAFGLLGIAHYFDLRFGYSSDPRETRRSIAEYANRALSLDSTEPYALCLNANQLSLDNRFDDAVASVRTAIERNPNDALVRIVAARTLINADQPEDAELEARKAIRVNPHYPVNYLSVLANALTDQGRHEEALALLLEVVERNREFISAYLHLTHLYMLMGRSDEARRQAMMLRGLDPDYNLAKASNFYISKNHSRKATFLKNLKEAGVPAGELA